MNDVFDLHNGIARNARLRTAMHEKFQQEAQLHHLRQLAAFGYQNERNEEPDFNDMKDVTPHQNKLI